MTGKLKESWVHVFSDRESGKLEAERVSNSYEEAMEDLDDYLNHWRKRGFELYYTVVVTENGDNDPTTKIVPDLDDELDEWRYERTINVDDPNEHRLLHCELL